MKIIPSTIAHSFANFVNRFQTQFVSCFWKRSTKFVMQLKNLYPGQLFFCDLCPHSSKYKHSLGKHMQAVHLKLRPFCCEICNHRTFKKFYLKAHMLTHRSKVPCPTCGKLFSIQGLKNHIKDLHKKTKKCEQCNEEIQFHQMRSYELFFTDT